MQSAGLKPVCRKQVNAAGGRHAVTALIGSDAPGAESPWGASGVHELPLGQPEAGLPQVWELRA